jgi:hypothetical protein
VPKRSAVPILIRDGDAVFKYAKCDRLEGGNGLLIYDYETGEKLSRHSDGNIYSRVGGSGEHLPPTTSVPFSSIGHEIVKDVAILSDVTFRLKPHTGPIPSNALVFSSTVLSSNGTFAAELVDDGQLPSVLRSWENHPAFVSAQTCRQLAQGKTAILTVLNRRSSGTG